MIKYNIKHPHIHKHKELHWNVKDGKADPIDFDTTKKVQPQLPSVTHTKRSQVIKEVGLESHFLS